MKKNEPISIHSVDATPISSPKWKLTGNGYGFFFLAGPDHWNFIPTHLRKHLQGKISSLWILQYDDSPVGPFQQLLFTPGYYKHEEGRFRSFSHSFVSNETARQALKSHFGIQSAIARFQYESVGKRHEVIQVSQGNKSIFHAETKIWGPVFGNKIRRKNQNWRQPVGTQASHRFILEGKGSFRFSSLKNFHTHPPFLPDLDPNPPFLTIGLTGMEWNLIRGQK